MALARLAMCFAVASSADVSVCHGENARPGGHKCSHDSTHRVCARLLNEIGAPMNWGNGDFWQITGQTAFQWDDQIRANDGDSWCIDMWATARLINGAGCDNVHLDCNATDVNYVVRSYSDGGVDLSPARECLEQKCHAAAIQQLNAEEVPRPGLIWPMVARTGAAILLLLAGSFFSLAAMAAAVIQRRRSAPATTDAVVPEASMELVAAAA